MTGKGRPAPEQARTILDLATILNVSPAHLVQKCQLSTPRLTEVQCRELARTTPYPVDEIRHLFGIDHYTNPHLFASTIALLASMAAERSMGLRK